MSYSGRFRIASTMFERLCGLLRKQVCRDGEALLLTPCSRIHTFGMDASIDVAFVNSQGRVLSVARDLPPNRLLACRKAVGTLERRANPQAAWYEAGDLIRLSST
ncbi:MAG: DUF192 domain-containing protein [Coriobacteriales bacterium]|jgi:uncharacterized membrane protein (UPF0127 family)|nr:DUF192 domain-containing protein [Coriobacteriales bacterium]